ncbi:hypothetical protein PG2089B_1610 [Bifidobacterium pseudolongum subsp. globosum]|nr:hypothetical protein PG2089B_1610 [Bifidobacterium pseudolongum subsp. globosum]
MARGRHCSGVRRGAACLGTMVRWGAVWVMALSIVAVMAIPGASAEESPAAQAIRLGADSIAKEEVLVSKPQQDGTESAYEPLDYTEQDGHRRYTVDEMNQRGWKYLVNTEFRLAVGTLAADHKTVEYHVPKELEVHGVVPDHDYELADASGHPMGRYTFDGTVFTFVFNDETIAANAHKPVEGWLSYRFTIDDDIRETGGDVPLPGGGVVQVDRVYDINVAKTHGDAQFNADMTAKIYPYTITIDSPHGTPGMVHVADVLKNGRIDGPIAVTDGKGNTVALRDAHNNPLADPTLADAWLPTMQPGERYTITYGVASTVPAESWDAITNTVQVHSSRNGTCDQANAQEQRCVTDTATTSVQPGGRPWQYKESKGHIGSGELSWVVHINANHVNLNGWTWFDTPDGNQGGPRRVQLCRVDAGAKADSCVELKPEETSHTFQGDDYAAYEIRYVTTPTAWAQQYGNTSRLCLEGTQTCETANGSYTTQNPIAKHGQITTQHDADGARTLVGRWTVRLDGGVIGYPANGSADWSVTDALAQPDAAGATHVLTAAQQDALREAVAKAFGAAADHAHVDVPADGTQFTVRVRDWRIPAGQHVEFTYESTLTLTQGTNGLQMGNCMADGQGYRSCANLWVPSWEPTPGGDDLHSGEFSIGKRDAAVVKSWDVRDDAQRADGGYDDTTHDYDSLPVSHTVRDGNDTQVPYVEWAIDVVASSAEKGDLTIVEHLPQGAELLTGTQAGETNGRAQDLAGLVVTLPYWVRDAKSAIVLDGGQSTGSATYLGGDDWNHPTTVEYARVVRDGRDVTITLPKEFLALHAAQIHGNSWRDQRIIITVRAALPAIGPIVQGERLENRVEASYSDGTRREKKQTQTITRDASRFGGKEVMNKVPQYDEGKGLVAVRNAAEYQLNINPKGVCVPDAQGERSDGTCPAMVEFTDVMTYNHEVGYDDSEFVLEPASMHVYRPARCVRAAQDGVATCVQWEEGAQSIEQVVYETSAQGKYGAKIKYCKQQTGECSENRPSDARGYDPVPVTRTVQVVELRQSRDYSYTVKQDKPTEFNQEYLQETPPRYTQTWSNTLTFQVPNEQPLIVQYRYKGFGNPQAWVGADNTFSLMSRTFSPTDESFAVNLATATAGAQIAGVGVDVVKIDAEDGSRTLPGAHFRLEEWCCAEAGGCAWRTAKDKDGNEVGDVVTDGQGRIVFDDMRYNRAYRLTETQAPEGYQIGDGPSRLFYIGRFKPNTNMIPEEGYPWECPTAAGEAGGSGKECGDQVSNGATVWIANHARVVVLPQAGGTGAGPIWLTGMGVVMVSMLGMGVVLHRRRMATNVC